MFSFSGNLSCRYSMDTWTLDLSSLAWHHMDPVAGDHPMGFEEIIADYDVNSQKVFLHDTASLFQYDYDANRFTALDLSASACYGMTGRVDPVHKLFVLFGKRGCPLGGGLRVFDISPGGNPKMQDWTNQVTGCDPLLDAVGPGIAFDTRQGKLVGWPNTGNTVYVFDVDTRSCSAQTFPNGPSDSSPAQLGTYARFSYFPALDVFALVNDWTLDAYTLRMTPP
jgi:hypothetical protein